MFAGKVAVSQSLLNTSFYLLRSLLQLHFPQLDHHGLSLLPSSFFALLGVDRLEHLGHQLHLSARCHRKDIAVKMDGTPLVFGLREHFSHSLQHTKTLVPNHQLDSVQATASQPLEEADPTGLVLFHTLSGAKNLAVSVLIYRNRHQNSYILILSAPVSPQIDPIHITFVNTLDVYRYLGSAAITVQNRQGMQYMKDFLGADSMILSSEIPQGKVLATPSDNIDLYYIDPSDADFQQLGLNYTVVGETPLIGVHMEGNYGRVMGETHALMGMKLWAEYLDGIANVSFGDVGSAAVRSAARKSNQV